MKVIVLCLVLVAVLLQDAESAPKKPGLRCHSCMMPAMCKKHNEVDCDPGYDTCQRSHTAISDPSGTENRDNYYAATTEGVMVWERLCATKTECEKAKKRNSKLTVTCCQEPLCNA